MRVEEALKEIDRFLDRSIVQEIPQVKILHGVGTGRLMSAIREHLEDMSYIKSVKKDNTNSGVTIVELA
jgi:DNA mismatch repair protein MutS2